MTGVISLTTDQIQQGSTNKYFPGTFRLSNTFVVADLAARDALGSTTSVQTGDVAIVSSDGKSYIFTQNSSWQELLTPTSPVQSVNGQTGIINLTTDNINQGAINRYASTSTIRGALSVSSPLQYDQSTGSFSLQVGAPLSISGSNLIIADGAVVAAKLDAANSPTDGMILSWNSGAGKFNWVTQSGGATGTIGVTQGGTGLTSVTAGDILYASADNVFSRIAKGTAGQALIMNGGATAPVWATLPTSTSGGEANTASNLGSGFGLFAGKSGVDIQFKSLATSSSKITISSNPNDLTLDVNQGALTLDSLGGTLSITKGGTGSTNAISAFTALAPSQSGQAGKFLKTNGTTSSWESITGSVWGSITGTLADQADLVSVLAAKEPSIATGTTAQYWRGDKTFQVLDKAAVGLGNIENTALSSWPGTTNIVTLGTITSGTWSGTTVATNKGGTGLTSIGSAHQFLTVNTGATGLVYRTLVAGSNISLSQGTTSVTIDAASSGEANTASNVGTGAGIFKAKSGVDLQFKSLNSSSSRLVFSQNANDIYLDVNQGALSLDSLGGTLSVSKGGTGQTTYTNGELLIGNSTGNTLSKATLTAGSGIIITNDAGSITIAASGGGSGVAMLTGNSGNSNTSNNNFYAIVGALNGNSSDSPAGNRTLVSRSGTLKNLYIILSAGPGSGKTNTYRIFKNGVSTSLVVNISGSATTGNNTVNTISLAAGDEISMKVTTQTNTKASWAMDFTD